MGVQPTLSAFSKVLYPSGVVVHEDALPVFVAKAKKRAYPNQTSWLSKAAAEELQVVMDRLSTNQLRRSWFLGRYVRQHIGGMCCDHNRKWVKGCGLLTATNLALKSLVNYSHDRLVLPLDLDLAEIKKFIQPEQFCHLCDADVAGMFFPHTTLAFSMCRGSVAQFRGALGMQPAKLASLLLDASKRGCSLS